MQRLLQSFLSRLACYQAGVVLSIDRYPEQNKPMNKKQ
jgi:hypothetical protein